MQKDIQDISLNLLANHGTMNIRYTTFFMLILFGKRTKAKDIGSLSDSLSAQPPFPW